MLEFILKLDTVKKLDRNAKESINGGFDNGICPSAGDRCYRGGFLSIDCLGPIEDIKCIDGIWTVV